MSEAESSNIQNHLTIDFPIRGPASAKALTEELPPLMPDLATAQDDLGTVHFSRFMVKGDEKLLFLADIDGEVDPHLERLVASAGPVFDAIFTHVEDPPATPVASNPERVIRWLRHHSRFPAQLGDLTMMTCGLQRLVQLLLCVAFVLLAGCVSQGKYNDLESKYTALEKQHNALGDNIHSCSRRRRLRRRKIPPTPRKLPP